MEHPLLDMFVFSTYKKLIDENIDSFHFSTVVLYELIASLIDESTMQKYQSWQTAFRKTDMIDYADKNRLDNLREIRQAFATSKFD